MKNVLYLKYNKCEIVGHELNQSYLLRIWLIFKTITVDLSQMTKSPSWERITFPFNFHLLQFHWFYISDH